VQKVPMADWHTYLKWRTVDSYTDALPKAFVDEKFAFTSKNLTGAKELPPRWKRCTNATDANLGEALAQPFVREHFGVDGKDRTRHLISELETALQKDIGNLPWMDEVTRKNAVTKLSKIENKVGYPDQWRNYDTLQVGRTSYLKNEMAGAEFERK